MRPFPTSFVPVAALVAVTSLVASSPLAAQEYYSDVRPILVEKCVGCHSDAGVAWSMEDPERTYARSRRIARAMVQGRMPPWLAEAGHQKYVGDLSLSPEKLALIQGWMDADYPKGEPRPDPALYAGHGAFQPDLSLEFLPGGAYLPNQESPDDYRCFLVEWPGEETQYVTGFRAVPGNDRVAHHVVVYRIEAGMVDRFQELANEEGGSYGCFGGAVPDRVTTRSGRAAYEERYPEGVRELARSNFWLAHWAPGMDGHVFPEGTGIRMDPGSAVLVQMHYYAKEAPGESDAASRLDFMVREEVDRVAFHLAQTRNAWLGAERNGTLVIPPGEQRTYEYRDNLGDLLGYIAATTKVPVERIQGLEIHSANLHMHSFGHSGDIALRHPTGEKEILLRVPRWDLRWQRDFTFVEPKVFTTEEAKGAHLTVTCTFENDTDEPVYGGYGSDEEMCFNFSYIAVREGEAATQPPAAR